MDEVICAACRKNPASQKHHISYNPPMIIDLCNTCHKTVHGGYGTGAAAKKYDPSIGRNRKVGRPPSKDRKTTSYTISLPSQEFINDLDDIAANLGIKRKEFFIRCLVEGMDRYEIIRQTDIIAFTGEKQEQDNIEQTARKRFSDRAVVYYKDVVMFLKNEDVPGKQRVAMTERLLVHFKSKGATIYR